MSLRHKCITPRARNFLWRAMHGAYKIGRYWAHIPGHEDRQKCEECNNTDETMEHILTMCRTSGQRVIWEAAKRLWALRGLEWPEISLGSILGCGTRIIRSNNRRAILPGATRLYRIIMTESAHLIWKLRCRWRIQDASNPTKLPTDNEIWNKWIDTINRRLQLECLQTNRARYGRSTISAAVVENTWWAVLLQRDNLPEDWVKSTGVLVGIGRRPPGRNR
ncbi:hypothetical protein BDN70DRAFT_909401 [Pholiota conissans]|uniref:Reverse transcriptase zinc-binding domain-containing protein n=1 Tax=Pholiota conissans TaxID=109636 RepID=A0A9P5YLY2_9AGAR|nr:hypothetical protein BDN70DRAFT_909401 [Pholiota conissans]